MQGRPLCCQRDFAGRILQVPWLQRSKPPSHQHGKGIVEHDDLLCCRRVQPALVLWVVSVDTGWISKMKPEPLAEAEPHVQSAPPLSAEDGAARVLDPVITAMNGTQPVTGVPAAKFPAC